MVRTPTGQAPRPGNAPARSDPTGRSIVTGMALAVAGLTVQTTSTPGPAHAAEHPVTATAAAPLSVAAAKRTSGRRAGPPTGTMYHVPDGTPYHTENSRRGIARADHLGYDQIDLDLQMTRDGVVVTTHWSTPMTMDGFFDPRGRLGRHRKVSSMTWAQVSHLRTHDGYRIAALEHLVPSLGHRHLIGSFETKGDRRFARLRVMTAISAWCRAAGARAYVKSIPRFDPRGRILAAARAAGFWTRHSGTRHQDWHPPRRGHHD